MKAYLPYAFLLALSLQAPAAETALTIYNQNFAVVRTTVPLDLKAGVNTISIQDVTSQLEPGSVILRDPTGKTPLQILEQSYRNDPVSQGLLLSLNEGKTINFLVGANPERIVPGKIIRSGYVSPSLPQRYQPNYAPIPTSLDPIIEVDSSLKFGLPGTPIFPSLGDDTILKPQLSWIINSEKAAQVSAELGYITRGMIWSADYNLVSSPKGDTLDLVGWVTMTNRCGKTFENARVKLMAGDVNKLPDPSRGDRDAAYSGSMRSSLSASAPPVTEKAFDEYHLYSLARPATLHDSETKQVEFVRASGITSQKIYVYDGILIDWNRWRGYGTDLRRNEEFGTESDTKVAVMREFKNSEANHLGIPLPAGRLRFYQQDDDQQLEFLGENKIDHTPKDETIRVTTGNAFDLVGERKRTYFKVDTSNKWVDESFEIKLRNHKKEEVEIRVVEHLYRWLNWEITEKSNTFLKMNAQEIEFRVQLKPDEEKVVTYTVHYSW